MVEKTYDITLWTTAGQLEFRQLAREDFRAIRDWWGFENGTGIADVAFKHHDEYGDPVVWRLRRQGATVVAMMSKVGHSREVIEV